MSTGHCWTQAPQFGHDHRILRHRQRGDLGVGVLTQAHHEQLGAERLLGVPGGALALAAAALGAGGEVEQTLPREVLDLADAELLEVLLLEVLHLLQVERLAVDEDRLEATEGRAAVGLALEPDVRPRGEAVPRDAHRQVGGDDEQPDHGRDDLDHRDGDDDVLERADVLGAGRVQVAEVLGDREVETGRVLGVLAAARLEQVVLRAADEQDRDALEEHHELDEVRLAHARAEETALALQALRVLDLAVDRERDDREGAEQADELADPLVEEEVADDRPDELRVEQLDEALRDGGREHDERQVDEPVQGTDPRPLEHPGVEERLLDHVHRAGRGVVGAAGRGAAGADDREHATHRDDGDGDRDGRDGQGDDDRDELHGASILGATTVTVGVTLAPRVLVRGVRPP